MFYLYDSNQPLKEVNIVAIRFQLEKWANEKLRMSLKYHNDELLIIFIKFHRKDNFIIYRDIEQKIIDILAYDICKNPILFNDFGKSGLYGWNIDHIVPLSFFSDNKSKLYNSKVVKDFIESFQNLQPLNTNMISMKKEQFVLKCQINYACDLLDQIDGRMSRRMRNYESI